MAPLLLLGRSRGDAPRRPRFRGDAPRRPRPRGDAPAPTRPVAHLRGDEGSVSVLVIGLVAVLLMLVAVVAAASSVFLTQRALAASADGAAVAAANAVRVDSLYEGSAGELLPLDSRGVAAAVAGYAEEAGLPERFAGFDFSSSTDGRTATVTLAAVAEIPFARRLTGGRGVPVTVTASARSPLTG